MTRMSRFLFSVVALACAAAPIRAADPPSHLDRVPADAEVVVSAQVAKLWKSDLFKSYREMLGDNEDSVAEMFGFRPSDLDRVTVAVTGEDFLAFITTIKPTDQKLVRKAFAPRAVELKFGKATCYRDESQWVTLAFPDDCTTLIGPSHTVERYLRCGHNKDGLQARTLKFAPEWDVVIGVTSGESGLPAIEKVLPEPFAVAKPLLKASHGIVMLDYPDVPGPSTLRVKGVFKYADAKAARTATDAAKEGWDTGAKELGHLKESWEKDGPPYTAELNPGVLAALKALHGMPAAKFEALNSDRDTLVVTAQVRKPTDLGTLALCAAFSTLTRSFSSDGSPPKPDANLEKVTRALLRYAKDNDGLPLAAIYAKDGKTPLLSWRVRILPYLGDDAKKLHAQFKLDEPWDSDHNIRLVMKMPKVFAPVADEEFATAVTPFQVFTGPDTLFSGPKPKALKDVTDGLANTILIAQATRPVPWTKPQDLEIAANKPLPLIGANTHLCLSGPTAQVAFADGKVWVLHTPLKVGRDPNAEIEEWADGFNHGALRGLITPSGGEKVDPDTPLQNPTVKNPPVFQGGLPPTLPPGGPAPVGQPPIVPAQPLPRDFQPAERELTLEDVVRLSQNGLSDRDLLFVCRTHGIGFVLTDAAVQHLKKQGISDAVIVGLQKAARPEEPAGTTGSLHGPCGVVRAFFDNIPSDKNPDKVLELFLSPDTPFTGVSGGAGRDVIYTKSAKELVASAKKQAATPHVIDELTETTLGDSLASVAVRFHTDFVVCKGVFTLTREGGDWRIAACVWESRLPEPIRAPKVLSVVPAGGSTVPLPQPVPSLPPLPIPPANGLAPSLAPTLPTIPVPAVPGTSGPPSSPMPAGVPGADGKPGPEAYQPVPSIPPGAPPLTAVVRWTNGERHPLEGTWRLLKWKDAGTADYAAPPHADVEQKTFSTDHTIWLVYDPKTKEVLRGAGATFQIKGDRFEEVPRYVMGPGGPKGLLDKKYESTWEIRDGRLHTWTVVGGLKTERIWERSK